MNKDCRQIWTGCFAKCKKLLCLCKPPPGKLRGETEIKDSRCSSTLTVLCDRRESELGAIHLVGHPTAQKQPYLVHSSVARLKGEKPRSSTVSLPADMNQRTTVSDTDVQIQLTGNATPNQLDLRTRCNSVPLFLQKELNTQVTSESSPRPLSPLARELNDTKSNNSEDSDANSETDNFIRESEKTNSTL